MRRTLIPSVRVRATLIRPTLAVLALAVWWLLVLAWAARISPGDPWLASHQFARDGGEAQSIFGVASADADGLRVQALGPHALALQSWRLREPISAADFRVLHYAVKDFPRGMELALIIRRADKADDVISVPLPWPGSDGATIDLGQIESWQGEIVEIGFSEYPSAQVAKLALPFEPFTVVGVQLESSSWCGLLRALFADWFAYLPWSQRSINALGRDTRLPHPRAELPVVALGLAGSMLLLWVILGVRSRRNTVRMALIVGAAGWLLLDASWMWTLAQRQQGSQMLYADKPWDQRKNLQMDADLIAFATRVRAMVDAMATEQKVLLWSGASFAEGRLAYHLRPLNVGMLYPGLAVDQLTESALLVIDDAEGQWQYAPDSGELQGPSWRFAAQRIYQHENLSLYRVGASIVGDKP